MLNTQADAPLLKGVQIIERFNVCVFRHPVQINGAIYTGATRTHEAKVRDRINAERWSKEELGFVCGDGIIAGVASAILEFGTIEGNTELDADGRVIGPVTLTQKATLAPDMIVDNFTYDDFQILAMLMGKEAPLPESEREISNNSSNTPPIEKLES
ncbi:hypothetical protein [Vibrio scophthalmi]|uniref:Uncharacterized protein n=1 Tax=Vibrio scophthalmi TaxID=45658 RepID=A0A1E3WHB7_9VIBR|nr:hypothetical protein [Vibrio scophthalmi]ODS05193.1 hypothetical protein VSF3289_04334 [Vibrio scophthalmi]